jgi:hypothetical protein
MIERGGGASLALKAFERRGIAGEIFGEKLERDHAAEASVFGAKDLAHAACAEGLNDFVMRYGFANHVRKHRKQLAGGSQAAGNGRNERERRLTKIVK